MAKKGKKRKHQQKPVSAQPPAPSPRPAPAPVSEAPAVDSWTEQRMAECRSNYPKLIELGYKHLASGDLKTASEWEENARKLLQESRRLQSTDPLGPAPVRQLRKAIDEARQHQERLEADRQAERKQRAGERLAKAREISGAFTISRRRNITIHRGNIPDALRFIAETNPEVRACLEEPFLMLETELQEAQQQEEQHMAQVHLNSIKHAMRQDADEALDQLRTFPPHLKPHVDLSGLEEHIEKQRPALEQQRRDQEEQQRRNEAERLYIHIMGYGRSQRVKPRDSLARLKEAERDQPELLARAAESQCTSIEKMRETIADRRKAARETWEAFQELEYLTTATTSETVVGRLMEICERDIINRIRYRDDFVRRKEEHLYAHRDAILAKVEALAATSCPSCHELARSMLDIFELQSSSQSPSCGLGWYDFFEPNEDIVRIVSTLGERWEKVEGMPVCDGHSPKPPPWQKQKRQPREQENGAEA